MRISISAAVVVTLFAHVASIAVSAEDAPPLARAPFETAQAREFQRAWSKQIGKPVVETNSIGMKLKLIPPGEFMMGRTEEQFDKLLEVSKKDGPAPARLATWEMLMMPAHRVRITKPLYMGATEVTVGQFRQFCEASGYETEAERGLDKGVSYKGRRPICTWRKPMVWIKLKQKDDEPVLHLCWNDCVAFCKWLSKKEGVEYCLPTEAEWEYACRAGTTTAWSFGNFEDFDRLGHEYMFVSDGRQGKHDRPSRVGLKKPNAFGLYDMHGNVWEYVADWWHRFTYKNSPINDPTGPPEQSEKGDMRRVIRTGSFDWGRWGAQSVYRMRIGQRSTQHPHQGFRVAMRPTGVQGIAAAVEPHEQRRKSKVDPGPQKVDTSAADKNPRELTLDLPGKIKMEFVLIRPGSFLMGSSEGFGDEAPVHRTVISTPFYMAKYEVTTAQWAAIMGKDDRFKFWESMKGENDDASGPRKAMRDVSWDECHGFVTALQKKVATSLRGTKHPLTKRVGYKFALPTEAQWEYACRAGSTTEFHFGNDAAALDQYAWFAGNMLWPGGGRTFPDGTPVKGVHYHDVGLKKPNGFGLYDMHGGVWEWCADYYDKDYYVNSPLKDPTGPESGRFRALRGGSWFRYAKYCRSAYRRFFYPASNGDGVTAYISDFGCRVVINLDGDSARRGAPDPKVSNSKEAPKDSARPTVKPVAQSEDRPQRAVNYTKLARSLVRYDDNPVIRVGGRGAWDEQTLGCFTVLDDGELFYFYSGGTQFGKPKNIGMATSKDGIHWTKHEKNPLFPGSMPYAIKVGDTFRLYHPGKNDAGRHGLQMRRSKDGSNWSNPNLVLAGGILDPCVVRVAENRFHLYYCGGGQRMKDGKQVWEFKAHMATSEDGISWKKTPKPALPLGPEGSWDSQSHAGPCVLKLEDGFHMWYLGSGDYKDKLAWRIGHATSPDGLNWAKSGSDPVLGIGRAGAWDGGTLMSFDIIFRNGRFLFWYAAAPTEHGDETKMTIQIGHGTSRN